MRHTPPLFRALLLGCLLVVSLGGDSSQEYDLVIYGGTSAGIAAAIQASRLDKSVIIIEPYRRLGGLTTGGLGQTDIGNKHAVGGGVAVQDIDTLELQSLLLNQGQRLRPH